MNPVFTQMQGMTAFHAGIPKHFGGAAAVAYVCFPFWLGGLQAAVGSALHGNFFGPGTVEATAAAQCYARKNHHVARLFSNQAKKGVHRMGPSVVLYAPFAVRLDSPNYVINPVKSAIIREAERWATSKHGLQVVKWAKLDVSRTIGAAAIAAGGVTSTTILSEASAASPEKILQSFLGKLATDNTARKKACMNS